MSRAIDGSGLKPIVDRIFPLDAKVEAFKHQESTRQFGIFLSRNLMGDHRSAGTPQHDFKITLCLIV